MPIAELTTETAEYTALPSGDVRLTESAGAVRVRRDGRWVPVDLALTRAGNGGIAPIAHPNDLRLSGGASGAGEHEIASMDVGSSRVALGWAGRLPAPVLAGERATYPDVLPGVDLVVESVRRGFAQTLVVRDRAAIDQVARVRLTLTGGDGAISYARTADGGLTLTGGGAALASMPALRMWDAQSDSVAGPLRSTEIATSVESIFDGVALTLTPDLAWMRDPATVFPVTLDPTLTTVSTTFDTYVWENHTSDYSAAADLRLGKLALATGSTDGNITRSFLTWNTSALAGKQITSATVNFYSFWSHTCDPMGWRIWTAGSAASASTRWTAQPTLVAAEAESTATTGGTNCADAWVAVDGVSFFQRAATAGSTAASMGLAATDETNVLGFKQFRSRDATSTAQVPYATVTYNAWPTVTSRATVPASSCVTGSGRPALNTLTPTLKATVSDADASSLAVTFEWWLVGGAQALGSSTVSGVASGATASVTIPSGALMDGGSYRWRVLASDGVANAAVWSSFCELTVYVTAPPASGCSGGTPSDVNGDGVRDLIIADPEATVGSAGRAGAVQVVYGGAGAVATLTEDTAGIGGVAAEGEQFGSAVAVYDVNLDGCQDVAVGAPFENVNGVRAAGAVFVLLGSPAGLAAGPASLVWHQDLAEIADGAEAEDWFGFALAAGQTAAGEGYLVIGAPGEDLGTAVDTGVVHYVRGGRHSVLDQSAAGANETDDRFGSSVAGSPSHLAVGHPGEDVGGQGFAGAVSVFSHTLTAAGVPTLVTMVDQATSAGSETPEAGDQMGASVVLAPYRSSATATGESALVIGVPGEDLTGQGENGNATAVADAGLVMRLVVGAGGLTPCGDITRATAAVDGDLGDGDYLGQRVMVVNLAPTQVSTPATVRVVVGIPGEDGAAGADTGAFQVFGWRADPGADDVVIRRTGDSGTGLPGQAASMDLLGLSAAASAERLYVASPYGQAGVYALGWSDLAAGTVGVVETWQPGVGGVPAGGRAFGAALG